jgi:NAD(P)-dependent dehydrogenase (short-subunit alcohol dehydrogenase family)
VTGGASGIGIETARALAADGIIANALHPGAIRTNLQRYTTEEELERRVREAGLVSYHWKTPGQGGATSVLLATSPLLEGTGGRYFEDCNEAEPNQPGSFRGVAAYALDPDAAGRLWQVSLDLLAGKQA